MSTSTKAAADATAAWWADQVWGGGAASSGDGMVDVLMVLAGRQGVAPRGSRQEFEEALAAHVHEALALDEAVGRDDGVTLSTDYSPEGALAGLARRFDLRGSFPMKTVSWTHVDHFTASLGYGAQTRLLWHSEEYERPVCRTPKYTSLTETGGRFQREPWKCGLPLFHEEREHEFTVEDPLCAATLPDGKVCLHSRNDDWHNLDDAWSSIHHEFVAPSEEKA